MDQAHEALGTARFALGAGLLLTSGQQRVLRDALRSSSGFERRGSLREDSLGNVGRFYATFVEAARFEGALLTAARKTQKPREGADYDAERFAQEDAAQILELADRFIAAVTELIGD
jgi:hypothetical protein